MDRVDRGGSLEAPAPAFVVLGVPGSGKSTLGIQLAAALGATWLSLDEVKEERYAAGLDHGDRAALRMASERELARLVDGESGPVVVDVWVEPRRDDERIARWLVERNRPVVQVLCRVPADVAVARYVGRRRDGPHLPADDETLGRIRSAVGLVGSLGGWPLIDVDTTATVQIPALAAELRRKAGYDATPT